MAPIGNAILCILFILLHQNILLAVQGVRPEGPLTFEHTAKVHDYPVEIHQIITEDEYILNIYRIPYGFKTAKDESKNKSAILIVHGMGGSAINFISLGRNSPAFYFADRGFDVWLICARGVHCQNHKKHKKYDWNKDPKYWEYSLHEIGFYDVSAAIDHVIKVTGQQKIFTIGHSSGGPELYVLVTERPEYNDKIKIITNYGGATIIKKIDYPFLKFLSSIALYFRNVIKNLGLYVLFPPNIHTVLSALIMKLCADPEFRRVCYLSSGLIGNIRSTLIEEDMVDIAFYYGIPRLSMQQIYHYADNFERGDFRKFNWGAKKNMKIYGEKLPPLYNMSACTCANAFFYGVTDSLSTPEDNWDMMDTLQNVILDYQVGPRFTHIDFIFAKNASHMVYEPTVKLFKDYDEGKIPPKITKRKKKEDNK